MGQSLFTDEEKAELSAPFDDIHATWARDITIWKTSTQVVISTDPNYNFFQPNPQENSIQEVPVSGVFSARIKYPQNQDFVLPKSLQSNKSEDQLNFNFQDGRVRIKLDPTGSAFIQGAKKVTFDGTIFEITSDKRPHGLFYNQFDDYFLTKVN